MTDPRNRAAGVAFATVVTTLAVAFPMAGPSAGAHLVTTSPSRGPQPNPRRLLSASEQMLAWPNGSIVNTIYLQGTFVGTVNASNRTFGMDPGVGQPAIRVTPNVYPTARAHIPDITVLVPGWGPEAIPYAPA
ncbi:MAG: hypothetical protein L3K19_08355 [Thermoplasmata archaeon]|nr:hypothetical protein [Thermoplasmata archaeon]